MNPTPLIALLELLLAKTERALRGNLNNVDMLKLCSVIESGCSTWGWKNAMLKSNGEKELLIFLFIFFLTLQPLNPILDDNKKFGHFERLSTVPHARASDTRRHHQRQFRNTEQRVDRRDDTRWKRFLALYAWLFVVQGVRANLLTCTGESLAVCLHARTHAVAGRPGLRAAQPCYTV